MNSTEETSPTLPTSTPTSDSSQNALSPSPTSVDELPLLGLTDQQMAQMSEDQLRAFVQRLRLNRLSVQTFRATLSKEAQQSGGAKQSEKVAKLADEFV